MKPVRIIFAGIICGIVSNVYADIASVQYVQSVIQDVDPTVTGADVALTGYAKPGTSAAVATTDNVNQAIGKLEKALDDKISANADITASGATNKIVQYDAKGLVVAGTTAGALATMDTVGSTEITDGSIVDADISSTAAISTSKINGLDTALAGKVPTTTTVNSKALISDITLNGADVALTGYAKAETASAVAATDTINQAIGKIEKALDSKQASGDYVPTTTTVNSKALSSDITLNGADVALTGYAKPETASAVAATDTINQAIGKIEKALDSKQASGDYVPTTTTVNSKALSSNITLDASDVGAVAATQVTTDGILTTNATTGAVEVSSSIASNKVGALTGYAKGSDSTALTTSDSLNQALGKVENQIDGKAPIDDVRFNTVSTTQPSGTPPTGSVFIWFN